MQYDLINGSFGMEDEVVEFFTIMDLIKVCQEHPSLVVRFLGTNMSVGVLGSWRGSYDIPAITPSHTDKTGAEVALELVEALKCSHWGYKGGEYRYTKDDEFYIAPHGCSHEYKVVKAVVEDGELVLYTKLDPY